MLSIPRTSQARITRRGRDRHQGSDCRTVTLMIGPCCARENRRSHIRHRVDLLEGWKGCGRECHDWASGLSGTKEGASSDVIGGPATPTASSVGFRCSQCNLLAGLLRAAGPSPCIGGAAGPSVVGWAGRQVRASRSSTRSGQIFKQRGGGDAVEVLLWRSLVIAGCRWPFLRCSSYCIPLLHCLSIGLSVPGKTLAVEGATPFLSEASRFPAPPKYRRTPTRGSRYTKGVEEVLRRRPRRLYELSTIRSPPSPPPLPSPSSPIFGISNS